MGLLLDKGSFVEYDRFVKVRKVHRQRNFFFLVCFSKIVSTHLLMIGSNDR